MLQTGEAQQKRQQHGGHGATHRGDHQFLDDAHANRLSQTGGRLVEVGCCCFGVCFFSKTKAPRVTLTTKALNK